MAQMSPSVAWAALSKPHPLGLGADLLTDFYSLDTRQMVMLARVADDWRYRAPKHANGSRLRYFYAYLVRCAQRHEARS